MAQHTSTYPGTLILPDGTEVKLGGDASISAELAKNEGVAEWISSGWLVPVAQPAMPSGKK
jgi:hypothetical protein